MDKRVNIGMKIHPSILRAIDVLAGADNRTRSNMIEVALVAFLDKEWPNWQESTGKLESHPYKGMRPPTKATLAKWAKEDPLNPFLKKDDLTPGS